MSRRQGGSCSLQVTEGEGVDDGDSDDKEDEDTVDIDVELALASALAFVCMQYRNLSWPASERLVW